jgi:hypothetical protein
MCSFTTVKPSDFVPVDIVYPHYAEESFEILPSVLHRWYFRSGVTEGDIILLKIYDNKPGKAFCEYPNTDDCYKEELIILLNPRCSPFWI